MDGLSESNQSNVNHVILSAATPYLPFLADRCGAGEDLFYDGREPFGRVRALPQSDVMVDFEKAWSRQGISKSICWEQVEAESEALPVCVQGQRAGVQLSIMFEEHSEQLLELERRREIAEGLRGILAVLNSNEPLNAILDYITTSASRLLNADAASIYRLNTEAQLLTIQSSRGLSSEYLTHSTIPLGQAATGQAVLEGKPVSIADVRKMIEKLPGRLDPDVADLLSVLAKQYRAVLSVPMIIKDEKVGALTLYYVQPRDFTQEEIDMAVSFCDQAALAIENARLRERIQEEAVTGERNRIARDLHDSVTQTLFSASLIAEVLPTIWKRDATNAGHSLDELRHLTRAALAEMRTLLLELRPVGLTEGRLEDLLKQLAEGISGRLRTPLEVRMDGTAILPPEVKLVFYRVAQEALNNLAKHSNAERAEIELKSVPGRKPRRKAGSSMPAYSRRVELTVRDNGYGFDPRTVTSEHMGLGIMRERAAGVQAAISIHSKPGEGTEVILIWPNPKQEANQ
ncbi:MAG: GAF domain-containing sensor histidine kinase [Chloroflexota bacterium]